LKLEPRPRSAAIRWCRRQDSNPHLIAGMVARGSPGSARRRHGACVCEPPSSEPRLGFREPARVGRGSCTTRAIGMRSHGSASLPAPRAHRGVRQRYWDCPAQLFPSRSDMARPDNAERDNRAMRVFRFHHVGTIRPISLASGVPNGKPFDCTKEVRIRKTEVVNTSTTIEEENSNSRNSVSYNEAHDL
jgi:hypothetical protein